MAKLVDGKRISQEIKDELKAEVADLHSRERQLPGSYSGWRRSGIQRICTQ